jgi:hypothetical protein
MSLAAFIVGYVNPTDDQRVPRLQPVEVEPVPDPKGQGFGGNSRQWGLPDFGSCDGRHGRPNCCYFRCCWSDREA